MATKKNPEQFGTTADYLSAFKKVLHQRVPPKYLTMLQEHYASPGYTTSWETLAQRVGYKKGNAINTHYGKFAHGIADELGVGLPQLGFWLYVLVDWAPELDARGHTQFVLRRPVIAALRELGVVV